MNKTKRLLALLLAMVMIVALTACKKDPEPADSGSESQSSGLDMDNPLGEAVAPIKMKNRTELIKEYAERNSDTIGWLEVPGTHIDDVVVCNTDPNDNNNYYYRRDFDKNYSFNGIFYADFRSNFGGGTAAELPINTIIYGHTMKEDPEDVMFAPLLNFLDEEFARENPYILFSTAAEDMVFEVFAVSYATVELPYNRPDLAEKEHLEVMNEMIKRSNYTYEMDAITAEDKILTLSTCTYNVRGNPVSYPNDYRYVVMARLIDKADATKKTAEFTLNPAPKEP